MGLRFCHITTFYPPHNFGGDGIGLQRLCQGLARAGHDVTVVCDIDGFNALHRGPPPQVTPDPTGVKVVRLSSGLRTVSPLLTQQLGRPVVQGRRIAALLEAGRFDVVNFHNVSLVGGPGLFHMGDAVKLYMAHEHWLVCASHVLWRYNREPCDGRECLRCVLSYRRPPQLWRYTGAIAREGRHIDAFIAMSEFSRAKHREFGLPFDMEVVPYFLPPAAPAEAPVAAPPAATHTAARPHQRPYFLFVGRLERIKGLDTVLPIFERYADADLLIAGDGEAGPELRAQAAHLHNVKFLGRVGQDVLAALYRDAIALIVPSTGFETFGIILIEAFRQRTPVIARRLGPFPEIVEQAAAGELFGDATELEAAMRRIQGDPALRERLAANGAAACARIWSEEAVIPRYLQVVRKAALRRGRTDVATAVDAAHTAVPA